MKILIIILINLFFNFLYLRISKKIIFTKYLLGNSFLAMFLTITYLIIYGFNKELILIHFPIYFFVFMSFFLTIGLKYINSPSEDIYEIIKKHKKIKIKKLIKKIKEKNIINLRIKDLINQKFIKLKNNKLFLTENGKKISIFFNYLKDTFKVKCKG